MLRNRWFQLTLIGLIAFFLFTRPTQAADAVQAAFGLVIDGADSVATFVTAATTK